MLSVLLLSAAAYLLGSTPWGLILARGFCGVDPRTAGSRNTGATNVSRLCGFGWGVATLLCDVAKAALPVALALLDGCSAAGASLVALCAVLGHVFSCFMGFRGGKAVSTSIGAFLPLAFLPILVSCLLCLAVIGRTGFVSAGSLTLVASLPLVLLLFGDFQWIALALCLLLLVAWRHRENIGRLRAGTETSFLKSRQKS